MMDYSFGSWVRFIIAVLTLIALGMLAKAAYYSSDRIVNVVWPKTWVASSCTPSFMFVPEGTGSGWLSPEYLSANCDAQTTVQIEKVSNGMVLECQCPTSPEKP